MNDTSYVGVFVFGAFGLAYLAELVSGRVLATKRPLRDMLFVLTGILAQSMLSGLLIGTAAGMLVAAIWPGSAGRFAQLPFWPSFLVLWVTIELMHYWLHRWSHGNRWLWNLHRTHHSAMDMNVGVVFRYNIFWTMLLPQAWLGTAAVYSGLTSAFAAAILTTFTVNLLTHTSFRWDLALREKFPRTEPIWRVVERVITLPDTHHAHHSYGASGHLNGNYAVTIFAFDMIFGTARIPNRRQKKFGLPISARLHWAEELFWPIVKRPLLPRGE